MLSLIESVLEKDPDPLVRKMAVERLSEFRKLAPIAQSDPSAAVRAAATRQIHEQNLLQRIARLDPDWSVRLAALQRLYEQRVEELVKTDPSPFVREAATRMVANEEILKSLARPDNRPSGEVVTAVDPWVITGRLLHEDGSPLVKQKILLLDIERSSHLPQDCHECSEPASGETSANRSFDLSWGKTDSHLAKLSPWRYGAKANSFRCCKTELPSGLSWERRQTRPILAASR